MENEVTNGKLFVFLSLFYGQFVFVIREFADFVERLCVLEFVFNTTSKFLTSINTYILQY